MTHSNLVVLPHAMLNYLTILVYLTAVYGIIRLPVALKWESISTTAKFALDTTRQRTLCEKSRQQYTNAADGIKLGTRERADMFVIGGTASVNLYADVATNGGLNHGSH